VPTLPPWRGAGAGGVQLLSPAGRPLQVTADLRGFWNGAYQEVKKEMKGAIPGIPGPTTRGPPCRRARPSGTREGLITAGW